MTDAAFFLQFDLPSLMLAILAALPCALLGNFLVLRRQSLMGDSISHVVLPGIVIGFLASRDISGISMLIGAAGAAILSVFLIELIEKISQVERGAAMGTTFTAMFAAGILLIEQADLGGVHLDVEHALYGNLESAIWLEATGWDAVFDLASLAALPPPIMRLAAVSLLVLAVIVLFYKELTLASFDAQFAGATGFSDRLIGRSFLVVVAIAAVAAFEAVGSVLVIALFVCPPAAARCLTDRLAIQITASAGIAVFCAIAGYWAVALLPALSGVPINLSAAAAIALCAGLAQLLAMLYGPRRAA